MSLNVAALGDSIVWGQGNIESDKFVSLVCDTLNAAGHDVVFHSVAHSGALVTRTKSDAHADVWGEVPEAAPSIAYQLTQLVEPELVDVLILNGGINDVSAFSIVAANPFDPAGLANLTAHTTRVFTAPVVELLTNAASACPRATIVVTGYYTIISELTDLRMLVQLMKHLPRPLGTPNFLDWTAEHLPDELLELAIKGEREAHDRAVAHLCGVVAQPVDAGRESVRRSCVRRRSRVWAAERLCCAQYVVVVWRR